MDGRSLRNAAKRGATVSRASDSPRLGFPRACRIVRRSEYDAVYRQGRRRSSREFTVFIRPNGLGFSRFGWSIKKTLGTAVRRNRIRRRLREIVRLHRQEIAQGWDIVIHPRSSVATAHFSDLVEELLKLIPHTPALEGRPQKE
ncbi:MAG: ribonuclease P protein component [Candidatus Acidiferrales bacterium]